MQNAGLLRRVGAMVYDGLLLFAVLMLATIPFVAIAGGEAVEPTNNLLFQISIVVVIYFFFVAYWTTRGRTLGMQSWGLQVINQQGQIPSVGQATLRFVAASIFWVCLVGGFYLQQLDQVAAAVVAWVAFGMGMLWPLWDKEKLALHDRLSGTRIVYIPRNK